MIPDEKIKTLRQKIEAFDEEILRLLNERAKVAQELGRPKKR